MLEKLRQVCLAFRIADDLVSYEELKTGNINRTYKVNVVKPDGGQKSNIVQEVNTYVFKNLVGNDFGDAIRFAANYVEEDCPEYEKAVRFLDDYILGSPYYKTNYSEHNLVRARCQIALAKDMLAKMDEMERIVAECVKKYV